MVTNAPKNTLLLQQNLLTLGAIPGVLDGAMGSKTRGAAKDAAAELNIPWLAGGSWSDFEDKIQAAVNQLPKPICPYPPNFYDLSRLAGLPTWVKGARTWQDIDHVNLHQTGCPMGRDPERFLSLKAHFAVTAEGEIFQIRPLLKWGYDAQGLSRKGVGIEMVGFFCGVEGDMKTRPGGPKEWGVTSITQKQAEAVKSLIRWIAAMVKAGGGLLKGCYPHRIATDDRTYDPGSLAWQLVGLPICQELGLTDGGACYIVPRSDGEPIPGVWDPNDPAKRKIPLINSRKVLGLKR